MNAHYYSQEDYERAREDFAKRLERLASEVRAGKWPDWDIEAKNDPEPIYSNGMLTGRIGLLGFRDRKKSVRIELRWERSG